MSQTLRVFNPTIFITGSREKFHRLNWSLAVRRGAVDETDAQSQQRSE